MSAEPNVFGFFGYLLFIFAPGIGLGELLEQWRKDQGLVERIGLAFGLGLSIDTLVLLIKTSGISVLGLGMRGIDASTVELTIAFGLAALVVSVVVRRRLTFPVRPAAPDLLVFIMMLYTFALLLLYFGKYPIFPQFNSPDFGIHVMYAQALVSGSSTSVPTGVLYYGVHLQLGASLVLSGGEPLVTVQRTMAALVVLSIPLVYLAVRRVFASPGAALVTTCIYSLSGTIWFESVFNTGLFPNFFGILSSMLLLSVAIDLTEDVRSPRLWVVFSLALLMAYFSHYSTLTILPSLLVLPVVQFIKSRSGYLPLAIPGLVSVTPVVLAAWAFPTLSSNAFSLAESGGGFIYGSTALSAALSGVPFLGYMAHEVSDDVAFVFLLALATAYVYGLRRSISPLFFIPVVWFVALVVVSPWNVSAWRFSYEALVPLTMMAGYGLYSLVPKLRVARKGLRRGRKTGYPATLVVLLILLVPILATSWGEITLSDSLTNPQLSSSSQQNVYTALSWLQANTPTNSSYLSVSDWRFSYSALFFNRVTNYEVFSEPSEALNLSRQQGLGYIIVTNVVTAALPPDPSLFPWNNFRQSANLTMVYQNDDVRIFKVV